jgi:hypothetical protein
MTIVVQRKGEAFDPPEANYLRERRATAAVWFKMGLKWEQYPLQIVHLGCILWVP